MIRKIQKIKTPDEIKSLYPVKTDIKKSRDEQIRNIMSDIDRRKLLIIGPCSLDGESGTYFYMEKLAVLAEKVKDKLFVIPRLYTAKPRSKTGFRGLIHSPDTVADDICGGVELCRKILTTVLNEFGFSGADELLYPYNYRYFDDLLSYMTVGARSSEDQEHRMFASGMDVPVGIKNPLSGNLHSLANAVYVAQRPNRFICDGYEVESNGNPHAHAVLRGYTDNNDTPFINFGREDVLGLGAEFARLNLKCRIVVDVSHANSGKNYAKQEQALRNIAANLRDTEYNSLIKGFMMESYLKDGNSVGKIEEGVSITDGCLGFERTYAAVCELCEKL